MSRVVTPEDKEVHATLTSIRRAQSVSAKNLATTFDALGAQWRALEDGESVIYAEVGQLGAFDRAYGMSSMHRDPQPVKLSEEELAERQVKRPRRKKADETEE